MEGTVLELPLEQAAFGDVAGADHEADDGRVVEEVAAGGLDRDEGAVGCFEPTLDQARRAGFVEQSAHEIDHLAAVVGVDHLEVAASEQGVGRVAP